ncbi:MAG: hypothetical protein DMF06_05035 [Verrucomicrobia bacterium]|nr:MAG: hypothetical protein DMF06_05035 [Verrucomicrobiota bacterium]
MTSYVFYESEAASIEIADGLVAITPKAFPHGFIMPVAAFHEFCIHGCDAVDAWEAEAAAALLSDAPIFERRHKEAEPADH